jgi:hypothetical protein
MIRPGRTDRTTAASLVMPRRVFHPHCPERFVGTDQTEPAWMHIAPKATTEASGIVTQCKLAGLSESLRAISTLVSATRSASSRSTCAASFWVAAAKVARAYLVQFAACSANWTGYSRMNESYGSSAMTIL